MNGGLWQGASSGRNDEWTNDELGVSKRTL
jgi:hypothetical protein